MSEDQLIDLGLYDYLPGKDLALVVWKPATMPDPAALRCNSTFTVSGVVLPEFDRFGVFLLDDAVHRVGKNLARVLKKLASGCEQGG